MTQGRERLFRLLCLAAAILGSLGGPLAAQNADDASEIPSAKSLENRIAEIEANEELDAGLKSALLESYRASLNQVNQIAEAKKNAAQFKKDAETAADRAEELQRDLAAATAELDRIKKNPEALSLGGKSVEQLEALQSTRTAQVAALQQQLQELSTQKKQRTDRRAEIERQQAEADAQRAELQEQLNPPAPEGQSPLLTEAKALEARLRLEAFGESRTAAGFELAKYGAEESVGFLEKSTELLKKQLEREEAVVARIADRIREIHQEEASSLEQDVRAEANEIGESHPFKDLATANMTSVNELRDYLTMIEGVERETQQIGERLAQQWEQFEDVKEKEELVGLTEPIGLLLREQRGELPNLREREQRIDNRLGKIEKALQRSWKYEREREGLPNPRELVDQVEQAASNAAGHPVKLSEEQRDDYFAAADSLLATRWELLTELEQRSREYLEAMTELDAIDQRFVQQTRDYLEFIDERILWIRSTGILTPADVINENATWQWMFSVSNWWGVFKALISDATERPFGFWPALFVIVALAFSRIRFRRRIRAWGKQASKRGSVSYGPTARAAVLTVAAAATIPLALVFLSWRLTESADGESFLLAVSASLGTCAAVIFPIELLRECCRRSGLAEAHFHWPPRAISDLRRTIGWLKTLGIPITFLTVLAHFHDVRSGGAVLDSDGAVPERLLFLTAMLLAAAVTYRLLAADGQFVKALRVDNPEGFFSRYHRLWHALGVGIPLALGSLSIAGYHYTAVQVSSRVMWTVWLAATVFVLRSLAVRWITLSRRRLLLEQAYQRRAAAAEEVSQDPTAATIPPVVEETDVSKSTVQTRRLLDIVIWTAALGGVFFVWSTTFPALQNALNHPIRKLWTDKPPAATLLPPPETPTDEVPADQSPPETAMDAAEPIADSAPIEGLTWLWLGAALLIALFTVLASRNLPGLMEMSILNRLPIDNATSYATTRLTSYVIVIVGILLTAKSIGLTWEKVQWLAAALSVGLGFGLQEVVANFVSGIIVLFERPVRVGDVVTIDGVTGIVSRIRMRATTITDWDRKEYIVPNKDFITGRLLNWTLSNSTNRMTFNVGLAFGSDTEQAREILLRLCDEHPQILKDPKPVAIFEAFGDSTLNLTLRCYLDGLGYLFDVTHDLHTAVDREFKQAGLNIAFPQRDLHVRSIPGEWSNRTVEDQANRPRNAHADAEAQYAGTDQ